MIAALLTIMRFFFKDDFDEMEKDPRSTQFMLSPAILGHKIPFAGNVGSHLRFIAQQLTGQKKLASGEMVNLRESWLWAASEEQKLQPKSYKDSQWGELLKYARGRAHTGPALIMSILTGENYFGQRRHRGKLAVEAFIPITPWAAYEALTAKGIYAAMMVGTAEFLGANTRGDYEDPAIARQTAGTEEIFREEVGKKVHRANGPGSASKDRGSMQRFLVKMKKLGYTDADILKMMDSAQGDDLKPSKNGKLTAYGRRTQQAKLMLAGAETPEQITLRDVGNVLRRATGNKANDTQRMHARVLLKGIPYAKQRQALVASMQRYGSTDFEEWIKTGKNKNLPTEFGKRLYRMRKLDIE